MKKCNDIIKSSYFPDDHLYMLWKYLNGNKLTGKEFLDFKDLKPADCKLSKAINFFISNLKNLGAELEDAIFYKDKYLEDQRDIYAEHVYKGENFTYDGYEFIKELIKNEPDSKESKSFQSILDNKFKLQDLENISACLPKVGMIKFFKFKTTPTGTNKKKLNDFIYLYIEEFIKDNLQIENKNYYRFDTQKSITLNNLEKEIDKYGKNFIFRYHPNPEIYAIGGNDGFSFGKNDEYLFIHSLIALEELGYLEIEKIWVNDAELPLEKQTDDYKIKVIIEQKYFDEKNNVNAKKKDVITSKDMRFTEGILNFKNKEIDFRGKPNQKDLLATLFKNPEKNWYYDEIYEDWGEEDLVQDGIKNLWRKLYTAGDGINRAIALETGSKKFIIKNTKQIQINPKYI